MTIQLIKRAIRLYPKTEYTDPAAADHARREWLKKVAYLRQRGIWILDQPVTRQ